MKRLRRFMARSKLPVLLLLYPGFAWLLSWLNGALEDGRLAEYVRSGVYAVVGLSFLFLLAVPLWSLATVNSYSTSRRYSGVPCT